MESMLLTGAYGFLGRNIKPFLMTAYQLSTIGLNKSNDYKVDLSTTIPCLEHRYDVIVHAAGIAHTIPRTLEDERNFYKVNVQGTRNLCTALEQTGVPRSFVFISSVAVYGCETGENMTEEQPLCGSSPYARSKIQTELFLQEWCEAHHVVLGILRPALIVGKNPPGNLGLMIRMLKKGIYYKMGQPVRKSVLLAEDIARIVPVLSRKGGIYNFCDTYSPTFEELEDKLMAIYGKRHWLTISERFLRNLAKIGDNMGGFIPFDTRKLNNIQNTLTFSNSKARECLAWTPTDVLTAIKL